MSLEKQLEFEFVNKENRQSLRDLIPFYGLRRCMTRPVSLKERESEFYSQFIGIYHLAVAGGTGLVLAKIIEYL